MSESVTTEDVRAIRPAPAWNSQECSRCPCSWAPGSVGAEMGIVGAEMGIGALLFPGLELFCSPPVLAVALAIPTFGPSERMEYRRPLGLGEVPVSLVL